MSDETLLDRVYEAAVCPETWPALLQDLAEYGGARGAALVCWQDGAYAGWWLSPGIEAAADYLASEISARSLLPARLMQANAGRFVADHELVSEAEFMADPYVTHCAPAIGMLRAAGTGIHLPTGEFVILQLMRRQGEGGFAPASLARLDRLRPHLARAAVMAARWRLESLRAMVCALEAVGLPAAVIGARSRVVCANRGMEAFDDRILRRGDDRIALSHPAAARSLEAALEGCARGDASRARSIAIPGSDQASPAVAYVAPVRRHPRDPFAGGFALLVATTLDAAGPAAELVRALFDLTASEAKVASELVAGRNADEIAGRQGLSRETVRSHVKAVLTKSGCTRQAEFVARFRSVL